MNVATCGSSLMCLKKILTCTRASVNFVRCANSSLVYTSGYWVRSKLRSNSSNCSAVNVVRERRCLRFNGMPGSDSHSDSSSLRTGEKK
ncbi:hypothetical protein DERF_014655 [Dermatophagoides farinae]|uniref:Uncharacterized protein n=1 Tax=Dermatophagoides farinae TaxID=6954 RepID=A0A922KX80_DERFA|nr:hypothetical protein DERF_014655 [Dermatophagoides farinae]